MIDAEQRPTLYVLAGLSGTGKTAVGNRFSDLLGVPVVDTDATRREIFPQSPHIPAEPSGLSYEEAEDLALRLTHREMHSRIGIHLSKRNSVIHTQTFRSPEAHQVIAALARRHRSSLLVVQLTASPEVSLARIGQRIPDSHFVLTGEQFKRQSKGYVPYPAPDIILDTSRSTPEETLRELVSGIKTIRVSRLRLRPSA